MSNSAGLFIGRSFLELTVRKGTELVSRRIAYSLNSLDSQLKALIGHVGGLENMDRIDIRSRLAWQAIEKRMGSQPAFITTSGLEHWLELNIPLSPETWSVNLKRFPSPLSKDLVFGVTERTSPKGLVEIEPTETELEFLVSKLKMNEVTNVAVGFVHSAANSANEKKVAEYFRANGFHVHASYEISNDREERPRFWGAALTSYIDPFLKEKMELVLKVITDSQVQPEIVYFGESTLLDFLSGPRSWLADNLQTVPVKEPFLYCGIDNLEVIGITSKSARTQTVVGSVGVPSTIANKLTPSLLSRLEVNFFNMLDWTEARVDIEPGPICMGRALVPTLIDAIAGEHDLSGIDGLKDKVNEKTLRKVNDAFKTYSRAETATDDLIEGAALLWAQQLAKLSVEPLSLKGPLAEVVQKLLKHYEFSGPATLDYYISEALVEKR